MKYHVLDSFKVKTPHGEKTIQAGQVVTLPEDIATALISSGKIEPLRTTFEKLFHSHMERMRKLQGPDELKKRDPKAYQVIQDVIRELDTAWYKEDLKSFKDALQRLETLYEKTLDKMWRIS